MASAIHSCASQRFTDKRAPQRPLTIHPRPPVVVEDTGPGAQPRCFDKGDSTAHPTIIPTFIDTVTEKPMMMPEDGQQERYTLGDRAPCPTYDREGVNL